MGIHRFFGDLLSSSPSWPNNVRSSALRPAALSKKTERNVQIEMPALRLQTRQFPIRRRVSGMPAGAQTQHQAARRRRTKECSAGTIVASAVLSLDRSLRGKLSRPPR
jgi:hypothetical protein